MKRILSVLLIALLATTAVFADWSFSGNFDVGYTFGFDGTKTLTTIDGDNDAPYAGYLYLKGGNDYISLDVRGDVVAPSSPNSDNEVSQATLIRNSIGMTATVDVDEMLNQAFDLELPVSVSAMIGNQSFSSDADYAYADPSNRDDEVSLGAGRTTYPVGLSIGYGSLVTGYAYFGFDNGDGNPGALFEVRTQPVDGIKANVALGVSLDKGKRDFQVSALADIGKLADLDFTLDVSASLVTELAAFADNMHFMAAVTGEYSGVGAYVEYEYLTETNNIYLGASYDLEATLPLSLGLDVKLGNITEDLTVGASFGVGTSILDLSLYGEIGVDDFSDFETGYVTVGTYFYF